jgi:hypothetical protein
MRRALAELVLIGLTAIAAVSMLPGALLLAIAMRLLPKQRHPEI